jgi:hypothetical protein
MHESVGTWRDWCCWLISAAFFVVGCATSEVAETDRNAEWQLVEIEKEISRRESAALWAYFNEPPTTAIKPMEDLIGYYDIVLSRSTIPAKDKMALHYDEVIARGRLAKLLQKIDRNLDAADQLQLATQTSRLALNKPITSTAELSSLIDELDNRIRSRWKR